MEIYELENGRFIIAEWRERNAQYIGHISPSPWQGYCYNNHGGTMRCEGHRIYGEGCDNEATERDSWVDPQHRDTVRALHGMKSGYMEVLHLCQDCAGNANDGTWLEYIGILETPSDNPNPKVKGE